MVGKTGMGKTLWTRRYIVDRPRVIILDPVLEYEGLLFDDLAAMIDYIETHDVYQVKSQFPADLPWLCAIAMANQSRHDVTLVIDEASRAVPSRMQMLPQFTDVVFRGRGRPLANGRWSRHVHLVVVSQRASSVSIDARSQWTRLVTFNQSEPNDTRAIENMTGADLDLTTLPPLEYYEVLPTGCTRKRLHHVRGRGNGTGKSNRDDARGVEHGRMVHVSPVERCETVEEHSEEREPVDDDATRAERG